MVSAGDQSACHADANGMKRKIVMGTSDAYNLAKIGVMYIKNIDEVDEIYVIIKK
ncbi:hypothetical protein KSZ_39590 [Dictyobacter formicarum]|uniref:Uncharacterized protein n=1 Tax=Dictyobacter formicarum TaxID=2778368 RepID=A0ABQ3VKS6_9CHLR|nr:hypothetical protein KSZ_39590 [Dictyobacter formicarum]